MGRIEEFEKMAFGMFVHFGLYSVVGKGEWYLASYHGADKKEYARLTERFSVSKNWARELAKTAKNSGCRYVTLTTRHHDGFSLYDTMGLNVFDSPHSLCGRDLVKEFVDSCREYGLIPFFYHTLIDWSRADFYNDFNAYIDYLIKSLEILCTRYGKIGGFWFDGVWDSPDRDWQEDRIYGTVRKYQPDSIIINNTGMSSRGKCGHKEIDAVTFERGTPFATGYGNKKTAGEMCQTMNDHWGYAENDINYKPVDKLIDDLSECRKYGCNFLLNAGLKGNGLIRPIEKENFGFIGKWIKQNKDFIYDVYPSDVRSNYGTVVTDGKYHYVITDNTIMSADLNVSLNESSKNVIIENAGIVSGVWLDNGEEIVLDSENSFAKTPFRYGTSLASHRVAKIKIK